MDCTMLIADDSGMNREILRLLFHEKYMVLEAANGKEAVESIKSCQGNIDIILLDLMMPEMNGFEVLQICQKEQLMQGVPFVVITGSNAVEDQIRAFKLGASDYVNKPFIPEVVVSRVNNVMDSRRRMRSIELEAERLKIKSELDQMTGLCNKTTSELAIDRILNECSGELHALLVIDIDNFKFVNDTAGHLAGDHTIRIVADLISSLFRKSDVVGRIGGDEYVVLMVDVQSAENVRAKVNELIQLVRYKPNLTLPANVSLSIGFAMNDRQPMGYLELFEKADAALYQAKLEGKARGKEYGACAEAPNDDERPIILLISRNRSVCSIIQAYAPTQVRVLEALTLDHLKLIHESDREKIIAVYADVSDCPDDGRAFWERLGTELWNSETNVLAICQEGELMQYREALKSGAQDILTTPIDSASFKRRTLRQLQKLGIIKTEPNEIDTTEN